MSELQEKMGLKKDEKLSKILSGVENPSVGDEGVETDEAGACVFGCESSCNLMCSANSVWGSSVASGKISS